MRAYSKTNQFLSTPHQPAFDFYYAMSPCLFSAMAPAKDNATPSTSKEFRGKRASLGDKSAAKLPKSQAVPMEETPVYVISSNHGLTTCVTHWNGRAKLQIHCHCQDSVKHARSWWPWTWANWMPWRATSTGPRRYSLKTPPGRRNPPAVSCSTSCPWPFLPWQWPVSHKEPLDTLLVAWYRHAPWPTRIQILNGLGPVWLPANCLEWPIVALLDGLFPVCPFCLRVNPFGAIVFVNLLPQQHRSSNTGLTIVYSGADQRKHRSSASLAFVRGIHRWPVNSPHKWPVARNMFPFDDVIMPMPRHYTTQWWQIDNWIPRNKLQLILNFVFTTFTLV